MFLWFVGTAVLSIWFVFHDDSFDYRPLLLGVLLPDVIDVWFGGARVLHSVFASVVVMSAIVVSTSRYKRTRALLMPLPIGMFLHLVYDAAFAKTEVFWWPFSGFGFDDASLPVADRWVANIFLEIAGILLIRWAWQRFGLSEPQRRQQFVQKGWLVDQKRR